MSIEEFDRICADEASRATISFKAWVLFCLMIASMILIYSAVAS